MTESYILLRLILPEIEAAATELMVSFKPFVWQNGNYVPCTAPKNLWWTIVHSSQDKISASDKISLCFTGADKPVAVLCLRKPSSDSGFVEDNAHIPLQILNVPIDGLSNIQDSVSVVFRGLRITNRTFPDIGLLWSGIATKLFSTAWQDPQAPPQRGLAVPYIILLTATDQYFSIAGV